MVGVGGRGHDEFMPAPRAIFQCDFGLQGGMLLTLALLAALARLERELQSPAPSRRDYERAPS